MHLKLKHAFVVVFLVLLTVLLSGCFRTTADELYSLPQASKEYLELQNQINAILSAGAEYSPPIAGPNRQSVQLKDIDSDGVNEAIAFFRTSGDKPLKIYIMKQEGSTFETVSVISGDGSAIESIRYADMNGDGMSELIIGWQMSALLHMTVYDIRGGGPAVLAEADYSKLFLCDLTDDGRSDVMVLRLSSAELPGDATLLSMGDNDEMISSSARLSSGLDSVTKVLKGKLNDGTQAAFIEGGIGNTGIVTDVFCWQQGSLVNVSLQPSSGASEGTIRTYKVYSTDINSDGIIEVPAPRVLETGKDKSYYAIDWYTFDLNGGTRAVFTTYHDFSDGWYMVLPSDWKDSVTVRREDAVSGERTIVFSYMTGSDAPAVDFLKVYTLSGDNKKDRAAIDERFTLIVHGDVIYAAEILDAGMPITVDKTMVTSSFRLIYNDWSTGIS